jgi:tetratricopeptide (TPR) repeat protein
MIIRNIASPRGTRRRSNSFLLFSCTIVILRGQVSYSVSSRRRFAILMQKHERKKEFYPLRPIVTVWDRMSRLVLVAGLVIGFLAQLVLGSNRIFAASVLISLSCVAIFKGKTAEPEIRHIYYWLIIPVAIGFSVSIFSFGNPIPAIIGGGISVFMGLWFFILKYPPEFRAASKALQSGDQIQALKLINQALDRQPSLWEGYQVRTVIHIRLFNSIDAESDARRALQLKPNNHFCLTALGNALMAQERYMEAKDVTLRALDLAPQYAINHYNRGVVSYRLGEFHEAIKYLLFAVKHELPGEVYMLGNYYLGCSLVRVGETDQARIVNANLKKCSASYEKLVAEALDAPDYPGVVRMKQELEDIKTYLE